MSQIDCDTQPGAHPDATTIAGTVKLARLRKARLFSRFRRLDQRSVPKRSACWDDPCVSALRQRHGWANGAIDDLKKWR